MCTIGYHGKLNLVFKNRDKNTLEQEVIIVKPDFIAVKSEKAGYYSLGINKYGCAFVSAAVNTPEWTSLVRIGRDKEAAIEFENQNKGLTNPAIVLSMSLPDIHSVNEWIDMLLSKGNNFMGYNILLAGPDKAVHLELHRGNSHVRWPEEDIVITNHFQHISHGPKTADDYPSSFRRLDFAGNEIQKAISLEDIFQILKTGQNEPETNLWRKGPFATISSSVIDLETHALYYSSDPKQDYARIAAAIPPKGGEKVFIEMSRYIDLPTYHNIERGHPFYIEMIEEIKSQLRQYRDRKKVQSKEEVKLATLELGAGTGLCSLELIKQPFLKLDALDIDSECCKILSGHPESSEYNAILGDAVTYCKRGYYDVVLSTFAHDHVHYDKRFTFAMNIYNNLKKGGIYIMGGELLPYFSDDSERKRALFKYHNHIIELALEHNRVQIAELENNALKSGLNMVGDFKRHEAMFEEEMKTAGFNCLIKKKMGPLNRDGVGGVFVYVFEKK